MLSHDGAVIQSGGSEEHSVSLSVRPSDVLTRGVTSIPEQQTLCLVNSGKHEPAPN